MGKFVFGRNMSVKRIGVAVAAALALSFFGAPARRPKGAGCL